MYCRTSLRLGLGGAQLGQRLDDDRQGRFVEVAALQRVGGQLDHAGVTQANQRLQAEARGQSAQQPEPADEDRVMPGVSVPAQVPSHDGRRGIVVVEQQVGDGVAALGREVTDQAIDAPSNAPRGPRTW